MQQPDEPTPNRTKFSRSSALAAGGAALLASSVFRQALSFFALIITARLLSPEDFGVFAYFMVATGLVGILQRQISMVLIRLEDVSYAHLHTVFTLQILLGFLLAGLFWLANPLVEWSAGPLVAGIMPAVSAYAVLTAFRNPRFALYERGLRFSMAVLDETLNRISYVVAAVWLAYLWLDYWALVMAVFLSTAVSLVFSYIGAPMLPKISLARWRDSLNFSSWAIGSQLCQYMASRAPLLFIGSTLGLAEAGIFRIGMRVTGIVTKQFFSALQRVVYPGLADVSRSKGEKKKAFMRVNAILLGLSLPLSIGTVLIAEDVIIYGLGEKWAPAALVIWIMAPVSGLAVLQSSVRAASYVDGTVRMLFVRNAALLFCVLLFMWIGTKFGFNGALAGAGLSNLTALVFTLIIARQFTDGGLFEPLTIAWRSFAACATMACGMFALDLLLRNAMASNIVFLVVIKVIAGVAIYVTVHLALWRFSGRPDGFETLLASLLSKMGARLRSNGS